MTTLRERLVKIGARIVRHGRSMIFQMAEVMVPRGLFAQILAAIATLRPTPPARCRALAPFPGQSPLPGQSASVRNLRLNACVRPERLVHLPRTGCPAASHGLWGNSIVSRRPDRRLTCRQDG
jgi:hypothetical protein